MVKSYSDRCRWRNLKGTACLFREEGVQAKLRAEVHSEVLADIQQISKQAQAIRDRAADLVKKVKPLLEEKMEGPIQVYHQTGSSFDFQVDNSLRCAFCGGHHGPSLYRCDSLLGICCCVRNHQPQCSPGIIGLWEHPLLNELMRNPDSDSVYVDIFRAHQAALGFTWKFDGMTFYKFDGIRWQQQSPHDMGEQLVSIVRPFVNRLEELTRQEHSGSRKPPLLRAAETLKTARKISSIIRDSENVLHASELKRKLDRDGNLLACANGVFDLSTTSFRAARADDYVSMSTNVLIPEVWDDNIKAEVESFMTQLYPEAAERDLIQR